MKKKYIGKSNSLSLLNGKVYDVISIEHGWYRIIDETDEDYLYPPVFFVDEDQEGYRDQSPSEYIIEHLAVERK